MFDNWWSEYRFTCECSLPLARAIYEYAILDGADDEEDLVNESE